MKQRASALLSNTFVQGGVTIMLANVFASFFNYLFNVVSAKALGPVGYSEVIALSSYILIFFVPISIVMTNVIRQLGVYKKNQIEQVIRWEQFFFHRINRYKLLLLVYFGLSFLLPKLTNLAFETSATLLLMIFFAFVASFYQGVLQGLKLFVLFAFVTVLAAFVKLVGPLLVFVHIDGLFTIFIFLILSTALPIIVSKKALDRRKTKSQFQASDVHSMRLKTILLSKPFVITTLSLLGLTLLNNLDVIYVKKFFAADISGIYGAWNLFAKIVFYIVAPLQMISLVFFSDSLQTKNHRVALFTIIAFMSILGFVLFLVYGTFASTLIKLMFTNEFLPIAPYLSQAAIFGTSYSLIAIINNFFLAKSSRLSLIILGVIPIYAFLLFSGGTSLGAIIKIDVAVSVVITLLYIAAMGVYIVKKPKLSV